MEINHTVVKQHQLSTIAARISTVILALGFSLLGFLSLTIKRRPTAPTSSVERMPMRPPSRRQKA
jgi:hypothetical protein